jgi:tetratricopeptide (TPR) repeat protein
MQDLPDNPRLLIKQAVRYFDKEQYRLASCLCWIELIINPDDYFALCWYANSLYFSSKYNDHRAASLYERAIEIKPSHPLAHGGLGRIHYSNVLRIHQEYSIFPGGSWVMFANEKSPENSKNENKISTSPMSYADSQMGNRKIAIKELEKAAELSSDRSDKVDLLNMAAEIRCIINNKDAIRAYKKILCIAPENIPAHFNIAGCYAATANYISGNKELAIKEYKFIKNNAPEVASDLESILAQFDINIIE